MLSGNEKIFVAFVVALVIWYVWLRDKRTPAQIAKDELDAKLAQHEKEAAAATAEADAASKRAMEASVTYQRETAELAAALSGKQAADAAAADAAAKLAAAQAAIAESHAAIDRWAAANPAANQAP